VRGELSAAEARGIVGEGKRANPVESIEPTETKQTEPQQLQQQNRVVSLIAFSVHLLHHRLPYRPRCQRSLSLLHRNQLLLT
jgi:hypothetical protein